MAIPSLSSNEQTASISFIAERKTNANVGLKPSDILCCKPFFISSVDLPLIDFAFIWGGFVLFFFYGYPATCCRMKLLLTFRAFSKFTISKEASHWSLPYFM